MEQGMTISSTKPSDLQILTDLVAGKIEENALSTHQYDRLRRIRASYHKLLDASSRRSTVSFLMSEFGVSQAQAYRDIRLSEKVFGETEKGNKAMKRQIAEEMALEAYRLAKEAKDLKAINTAVKNYIDATGANIDDPDMPEFDKLQPNIYPIVLDEHTRKLFGSILAKGGSFDLSELINKAEAATDIPHEEVS